MTEHQDYKELTGNQIRALVPMLQGKFREYQAKGGDPENMDQLWRWLSGADHRCDTVSQFIPIKRALLDREKAMLDEHWMEQARLDAERLKDEDLSEEPDAW